MARNELGEGIRDGDYGFSELLLLDAVGSQRERAPAIFRPAVDVALLRGILYIGDSLSIGMKLPAASVAVYY
jgi:hypothetical protein